MRLLTTSSVWPTRSSRRRAARTSASTTRSTYPRAHARSRSCSRSPDGCPANPLEIEASIAASPRPEVKAGFAVHDAHHGVVVDLLEVIVDGLTVVDHRRGHLAPEVLEPQAGFALAPRDV